MNTEPNARLETLARIVGRKLSQLARRLSTPTSRYWVAGHPRLLAEWHPTKNGDLFPDELSYGSGRRIWWRCPKGPDHVWRATACIPVDDETFAGNCAVGSFLTQEQADFITQRVFPNDFAGLSYDAATCTTTESP